MPLLTTRATASAFGWLPRTTINPSVSSVESTLWAGGSNDGPGGSVVKYTGDTIVGGQTYSVVIGGASTGSSALGRTAASNGTQPSNNVNGTVTTYNAGSGSPISRTYGDYTASGPRGTGLYYNYNSYVAGGGYSGAGGNGGNAVDNFAYDYVSGAGGAGFTAVTGAGLSGYMTEVGRGSSGYLTRAFSNVYWYGNGTTVEMYGYYGNYTAGANTGVGGAATGASTGPIAAGSGGFTMRYSNAQLPLAATAGDVVYLNSGGYHNYFWKSTGSFTV